MKVEVGVLGLVQELGRLAWGWGCLRIRNNNIVIIIVLIIIIIIIIIIISNNNNNNYSYYIYNVLYNVHRIII